MSAPTPPDPTSHTPEQATPADLKVRLAEQKLLITWRDGRTSEYSLAKLRTLCPCATCRTEREKRPLLPILKSDPTGVHVTSAQLVGNYAIQFFWSDGHSTGIFDFRYLRSLHV
jgi:DUF971 family protein